MGRPVVDDPWASARVEDLKLPPPAELDAPCPACHARRLVLVTLESEVPHFGRALKTLLRCHACGFKNVDFMMLDLRDPTRLTLRCARDEHLWSRVIRSNSCTWSIPELGFRAEPTTSSESFITNVEGLLDRAADVLVSARNFQEDPAKRRMCEDLLERCQRMVDGAEPVTVVLEDPFGNSALVHADTVREALSPEEAAALAPGMVIFDKDDLKDEFR